MSFGAVFALALGLFVVLPVAAHLLKRKRSDSHVFPPAKLIPTTRPAARKRSALEDRFLFGMRALSIAILALLGATPFVSCSHLAINRKGGASVALVLVVDDSLSMRAKFDGKRSRFERAVEGARELVKEGREGDSFAIVAAGAPPRVLLALSTDAGSASRALDDLTPSDRGTDLDGALALSLGLLKSAPQVDKRVVLFSDRADGHAGGAPLDVDPDVSLWEPLPELAGKGEADCAVVSADRAEQRITVEIACSPASSDGAPAATAKGRTLSIKHAKDVVKTATVEDDGTTEVTLDLPKGAPDDLLAELSAGDAIDDDDRAPVSTAVALATISIVADPSKNRLVTGGPPPVEQAFAALGLGASVRPAAGIAEHQEDLHDVAGLILDDPPGLTPEQREAVLGWVQKGGVLLISLGPSAASAPLGAGFDGFVPGVIHWSATTIDAADRSKCTMFGDAAASLDALHLDGRTELDRSLRDTPDVVCAFSDGAPLLVRRDVGRGAVFIVTIPFSVEHSDFALRPAFLSLLDRFAEEARAHGGTRRVIAGQDFTFGGAKEAQGFRVPYDGSAHVELPVFERGGLLRATPSLVGRYEVDVDGEHEARAALFDPHEIDLRPRAIAERAHDESQGQNAPKVDVSPYVAFILLGLLTIEVAARIVMHRSKREPHADPDATANTSQ